MLKNKLNSIVWPINNNKNKLKVEISWKIQLIPDTHIISMEKKKSAIAWLFYHESKEDRTAWEWEL